ncbi:response regulator [Desulfuromonas thiophila]|uniref:HDIG domain-containing protein n=1 Tax=Desulfuromonas thiophila TaxID=57664 RepID=A0A1G7CXP3_9BACT|nr:response regulator [Desulfuromonas thiophila]SDE43436.1 HDIG domain-containing protein [Desulfuromonas thiophila]
MNSVLFVDDNLHLLQGLKRGLRSLRAQWEMHFVASGQAALDFLAQRPVDVVITDYRMPGMSGFELLSRIQKDYPATVRIVLTGQPDRETYGVAIGVCHYFLWKPLDIDRLKPLLDRLAELNGLLENPELTRHLRGLTTLPTFPEVYNQLTQLLDNPEADRQKLLRLISHDISLTMQILKMVNSAFIGLVREISTLDEAIQYLGLNTIRSLVLAHHVFNVSVVDAVEDELRQLWEHSCTTAWLAEALVRDKGDGCLQAYTAFAGLLHDLGKLVLIHCLPEVHQQVNRLMAGQGLSRTQAELEILGCSHAAIGAYLAQLWGLPHSVVEAIYLHHLPEITSGQSLSEIAEATWHANRISRGDHSLSQREYQMLHHYPEVKKRLETLSRD